MLVKRRCVVYKQGRTSGRHVRLEEGTVGLFDDLRKAGDALAGTIKKAAESDEAKEFVNILEKVAQDAKEKIEEGAGEQPEWARNSQPAADSYEADYKSEEAQVPVANKIRNVMASEFPDYTLLENVSPITIGGTGRFMNYSFGAYKDGQPKLFMMIVGKTTCSHREYRWSKEQAQAAGVEMINFVEHYPNKIDYIVNRLHQYL